MDRLKVLISSAWFVVGLWLFVLAIRDVWHAYLSRFYSGLAASLTVLGSFAILAIVGAVLGLLKRRLGFVLLCVAAGLMLLYCIIYVLFGGFDDAASYAPFLLALAVLSFATFPVVARSAGAVP